MRVLITTDAFPPNCGGSGWSTHALAQGLRARGHEPVVVQPRFGDEALGDRDVDGVSVTEYRASAPRIPFLRNYVKNERFYTRFASHLDEVLERNPVDVVHAQHVLTGPPSVRAARARRIPVVCTVRDYWPLCYWTDLLRDDAAGDVCPGCSAAMMSRCLRPRAGAGWPLTLPFIPYMQSNLRRKRSALAAADAVVAVSASVAELLRQRAPELAGTRLEVIPNPIDVERAGGTCDGADVAGLSVTGPFALYVGKLAPNKGVRELVPAMERSGVSWPLVVVGDGPEREAVERQVRASACRVEFTGWLPRNDVDRWLRHASVLVFPSRWPEPLSRVLLEASAAGVPIAAMDTGGTRDIVVHEETGLLSRTPDELADAVARLCGDRDLRRRMGDAARRAVADRFSTSAVVSRMETLYGELIAASDE